MLGYQNEVITSKGCINVKDLQGFFVAQIATTQELPGVFAPWTY
jgi:hypothetical protein